MMLSQLLNIAFDPSTIDSDELAFTICQTFNIARINDKDICRLINLYVSVLSKHQFGSSFESFSFIIGLLILYKVRPIHYLSWNTGICIEDLNTFSEIANCLMKK
eukprot:NODE_7_length_67686_cov_1.621421.p60 type:complete len:105 gc:universal NODE_7_length_67686_cov_1.621421:54503-54817(+)